MKRAKAAGNDKDWMAVKKAKAEVRAAYDAQGKAEARIEAEVWQAEARAQEFKQLREQGFKQLRAAAAAVEARARDFNKFREKGF